MITIELVGGFDGPVTMDSDRNAVVRITDPINQKIRLVFKNEAGTDTVTKVYKLYRLNLEEPE